jgi:hypothetical protein
MKSVVHSGIVTVPSGDNGKLMLVKDTFHYPSVSEVVRVSVMPAAATASAR